MSTNSDTAAAALREAADLIDAHDLPYPPYVTSSYAGTVELSWYLPVVTSDLAAQKTAAAAIVRAIGGKWNKHETGEKFNFTRRVGLLRLHIQVERPAVCERVVVGTETRVIPAQEAQPAQPERVEEVEKVEWRCQPLLADDQDAA